jgi:hypothetical protein
MKHWAILPALLASGLFLAALPGCDDKGLEKTGEKIDNSMDNDNHTLERAGEEADEAIHNKNDKLDDAIDDARDNGAPNN